MKIERVVRLLGKKKIIHISSSGVHEIKVDKDEKWTPSFLEYLENYTTEKGFRLHSLGEYIDQREQYYDAILVKDE